MASPPLSRMLAAADLGKGLSRPLAGTTIAENWFAKETGINIPNNNYKLIAYDVVNNSPRILLMLELCMSGQALRIFLRSSLAQTMNAFIGRFT